MMAEIYDHVLAGVLLLVYPAYVAVYGKRELAKMNEPGGRTRAFRSTMEKSAS